MKNTLYFLLVILVLSSCATTKTASVQINPTGDWNYSITGTPEGDFSGIMTVGRNAEAFTAKMTANGAELPLENFAFNDETKKVTGLLYYSGTPVSLDALLNGEEMTGFMSAEGMNFPFKATRKK